MGRNEFIKIGNTRIKLSNIKHYGISEERKVVDRIVGEYRRKIWFSDFTKKKSYHPRWDDMTRSECNGRFEEFEAFDDSFNWKNYIDIDALKIEYEKVKAVAVQKGEKEKQSNKERNKFTAFFKNILGSYGKIDEERSEQEVTVSFYEDDDSLSDADDIVVLVDDVICCGCDRRVIFTKGKLYFDGRILRCEGSPFRGARIVKKSKQVVGGGDRYFDYECKEICSQDRIYAEEAELINSGELTKTYYDVAKNDPEVVIRRYLEITNYQNEKFTFEEDECDIDNILKKLDDNFTL